MAYYNKGEDITLAPYKRDLCNAYLCNAYIYISVRSVSLLKSKCNIHTYV